MKEALRSLQNVPPSVSTRYLSTFLQVALDIDYLSARNRDLPAIAICDSNCESQIGSDLSSVNLFRKSSLF